MGVTADDVREVFRMSYRNTRSTYGRECLKIAMQVLSHEITQEQCYAALDALDMRYGKSTGVFQ